MLTSNVPGCLPGVWRARTVLRLGLIDPIDTGRVFHLSHCAMEISAISANLEGPLSFEVGGELVSLVSGALVFGRRGSATKRDGRCLKGERSVLGGAEWPDSDVPPLDDQRLTFGNSQFGVVGLAKLAVAQAVDLETNESLLVRLVNLLVG